MKIRPQSWLAIGVTAFALTFAGCPGETPEDGGPGEPDAVEPEDDAGNNPDPVEPEDDAGNNPDPVEPEDDAGNNPDPVEPEDDAGNNPEDDAGPGEPEDGGGDVDGGEPEDGGGDVDGGGDPVDGGGDVDGGVDPVDGGGEVDGGPLTGASAAIAAALAGTVPTTIDGALVTDVKEAIGSDPAGFFIQADQTGPALFIAIDATTAGVATGDNVSFEVTTTAEDDGRTFADAIGAVTVNSSGNDVSGLIQDVTNATDLVSAIDDFEAELVMATVTITDGPDFAGTGFDTFDVVTTGFPTDDRSVRLRFPNAFDVSNLGPDCTVTTRAHGLWRFNNTVQISIFEDADLTDIACPAATFSARATSDASVVLTASRDIDATTVLGDGSGFTFDNGLTATAAVVDGRTVTITTSAQTIGTTYTVTVANTVTDVFGEGFAPNTATFAGFEVIVAPSLLINELDHDQPGGDDDEFIELVNTGSAAIDLASTPITMIFVNGNGANEEEREVFDAGVIPVGGRLLIGEQPVLDAANADLEILRASPDWQNSNEAIFFLTADDVVFEGIAYEGEMLLANIGGVDDVDVSAFGQDAGTAPTTASLCRLPDTTGPMSVCDVPSPGAVNPPNP